MKKIIGIIFVFCLVSCNFFKQPKEQKEEKIIVVFEDNQMCAMYYNQPNRISLCSNDGDLYFGESLVARKVKYFRVEK